MRQVSNLLYCSEFLYNIPIASKLLNKPYCDYPFLIIGDFFSKEECGDVLKHIKTTDDCEKAKIKTALTIVSTLGLIDQSIRKTDIYSLTFGQNENFGIRFDSFRPQIEKFFNVSLLEASDAQALSYGDGDFYIRHADDSSEIIDDDGAAIGYRQVAPHRIITTVLFLNGGDDFAGGELVFSHLTDIAGTPFCFKPKSGFMIIFPSNPYFAHEVLKVTSGHRATLVKWHDAIVH